MMSDSADAPAAIQSKDSLLIRGARQTWKQFRIFLEIIGILPERKEVDHAGQLAKFKLNHTEFRKLLSANNSFLETLVEMEEKRQAGAFIDRAYVKRKVVRAVADIHSMVESINAISGDRYPALRDALDRINGTLMTAMEEPALAADVELVLDLPQSFASHADIVGGKMANLGEIRNEAGVPTPDGFSITTEGFRLLVEEGGLRSWIQSEHMGITSPSDVVEVSESLRRGIMGVTMPPSLKGAILAGYDRLADRVGTPPPVAVRSSAVGEDSHLSFAGQFHTVLNVTRENLLEAYLQVIASLYSPEAVHYRMVHGIPGESAEMAVGVIAMIPALVSGVAFSQDPNRPRPREILIQAVRGLGVTLVDGKDSPEVVRVSLPSEPPQIVRVPSAQTTRVVPEEAGGVREEPLPPEEAAQPCLTDEDAIQLARWARDLEQHFGSPQDVEWAATGDRRLFLLQSRPLRIARASVRTSEPVPGYPVLLSGGEVACAGVGAGPAVHLDEDGDMDSFPTGAVLVARRSSPRFVRLMTKARAIVTDAGSTTGHMASLARELRVPTLLNTRTATRSIASGALVTVDAGSGFVYEGEVPSLLEQREPLSEAHDTVHQPRSSPDLEIMERAVPFMAPLNLTDPQAPGFAPEGCRTLHDLARYVHERSYQEMFGMGEKLGDFRAASYHLDVFLPVDLYIIDLGGGLKEIPKGNKVKRSQIASVPMTAVLKGMLHEKIPRFGPRFMDVRGLFSVMMRHATTSPEQERSFQDPCYALISDSYLNYTARVGYHFSVLDTYCSPTPNKNYIAMLFRGGAADLVRRSRRVRSIGGILRECGFTVNISQDTVYARMGKGGLEEIKEQLEMLGRLLQFFRQMDAAMASDEHARLFQEAFLKGDYDLREMLGGGNANGAQPKGRDSTNG
jgi:pyruvate, water dikinase